MRQRVNVMLDVKNLARLDQMVSNAEKIYGPGSPKANRSRIIDELIQGVNTIDQMKEKKKSLLAELHSVNQRIEVMEELEKK